MIKKAIKTILKRFNLKLTKYTHSDVARRMAIMRRYAIDKVLDVGANTGQYAKGLRADGYSSAIVSFEPQKKEFDILAKRSSKDKNWTAYNCALGERNKKKQINLAGNSGSSSLLEMSPRHLKNYPESKYVGTEEIDIKMLDSIFDSICSEKDNIMLKMDTQGYEQYILEGAQKSLKNIKVMQLELSVVPLYEGGFLFSEALRQIESKGFALASLEGLNAEEETGQLLFLDAIFTRKRPNPLSVDR